MASGLCREVFFSWRLLSFGFLSFSVTTVDRDTVESYLCPVHLSTIYCPVHHLVVSSGSGLAALSQSSEGLNLSPSIFFLSLNLITFFSSNIILFFLLPGDA